MTAHLTLPYNWADCTSPETCQEYIHLHDTAENLNNYPKEWVTKLLPEEYISNQESIKLYNQNKKIHSNNGPAIEHTDGELEWYREGELHREDGPAREWGNGEEAWYLFGKRHRENGPAVINSGGNLKHWYCNGQLHREDGPAVENPDGEKNWYINGQLHRENGPAVINADGSMEWWEKGVQQS